MTYLRIDTTTMQAQKLVAFLETFPFVKILDKPNSATKMAIEDARLGKTKKAKSLEQLFAELKK